MINLQLEPRWNAEHLLNYVNVSIKTLLYHSVDILKFCSNSLYWKFLKARSIMLVESIMHYGGQQQFDQFCGEFSKIL